MGAWVIDTMAVVVIVATFLWASARFVLETSRHGHNPYERYKRFLGRALSLGLEFLVAADVIRTVVMPPTLLNIGILGAVILTRTFLSWSLVVEMESRWPWQSARVPTPEVTV